MQNITGVIQYILLSIVSGLEVLLRCSLLQEPHHHCYLNSPLRAVAGETAHRYLLTSPLFLHLYLCLYHIDKNNRELSTQTRSLLPYHQYQPGPRRNLTLALRPDRHQLRHQTSHHLRLLRTSYLDYPALVLSLIHI